MVTEEEKQIRKAQNKVLKKYPNAKITTDEYGLYYLHDGDLDLNQEFMIPHTPTKLEAWNAGWVTVRTSQNFNRTHPLKTEMKDFMKAMRIVKRRQAKRNNQI